MQDPRLFEDAIRHYKRGARGATNTDTSHAIALAANAASTVAGMANLSDDPEEVRPYGLARSKESAGDLVERFQDLSTDAWGAGLDMLGASLLARLREFNKPADQAKAYEWSSDEGHKEIWVELDYQWSIRDRSGVHGLPASQIAAFMWNRAERFSELLESLLMAIFEAKF